MTLERAADLGRDWADECFRLRTSPEFEELIMRAMYNPSGVEKLARDRLITLGLEGTDDELRAFVKAAFEKMQIDLMDHLKREYFPKLQAEVST